jgi:hypothetical protein
MKNTLLVRQLFNAAHKTVLPINLRVASTDRSGPHMQWAEVYGGRFVWVWPHQIIVPPPAAIYDLSRARDAKRFDSELLITG